MFDGKSTKRGFLFVTMLIVGMLFSSGCGNKDEDLFLPVETGVVVKESTKEEEQVIIVEIKGQVVNPGVYALPGEHRLNDLLSLSGGVTENANLRHVNLAMKMMDGDSFYIPAMDEEIDVTMGGASTGTNQEGKIDLNRATKEELMTVTGIGPATADNILAYRDEHGPFKTVDGLLQVNRIGEKTLDKIKDSFIVR